MRPLNLAGLAVATAGVFGLVLEHLVFAASPEVIRGGSIKVLAKGNPVPTIVAVFAIVAGVALVYLDRTRKRAATAE